MFTPFSSIDKDPVYKEIEELFCNKPEALAFVFNYMQYVHYIDDLVDEAQSVNNVKGITTYASIVYSSEYWHNNRATLYIVDRLISNQYFDSVTWEHTDELWKKQQARVLNQCGYMMLFAVILLEFGEIKLTEISIKFREYCHNKHKDDKI